MKRLFKRIFRPRVERNRLYLNRMVYVLLMLGVVFGVMFWRVNSMMRASSEAYAASASSKSTRTITLYGKRGTIYDTDMTPLAYDRTSYDVTFYRDPSRTSAADRAAYTQVLLSVIRLVEGNGKSTVNDFWMKKNESGQWVFSSGASSETVEATRKNQWMKNFSLTSTPEANWFQELCNKYSIPADLDDDMKVKVLALWQESRMNAYNSMPCTIAYDVGFETISEIEVHSIDLDGVDVTQSSSRVYPQGSTACHIIGYISRINSDRLEDYRSQGYPLDAFIGSDGIESSMELQLSPYIEYRQGKRVVEVSTRGKVIRELSYTPPVDGNSIVLTIDKELQDVMRAALVENIQEINERQQATIGMDRWRRRNAETLEEYERTGRSIDLANSGAIVAMDPNSGRVLGLCSYPDFNLSYFNGGTITQGDWAKVLEGNDPLYNRAVSAKDSPGSIFKMVTSIAALSEGTITLDTRISDRGAFTLTDPTHPPKCWTTKIENHQNQTIIEGLKNSCNYFFYEVGYRLGVNKLYKWAAALGLTSRTNIELPGETTSFVGNQNMLYDADLPISQQYTYKPMIAANAIRAKIIEIGQDRGIEYDEDRINEVTKKLLDVAVSYNTKAEWAVPIREILLYDLNLPESYIVGHYLGNTMTSYIQELQWTPNETIMLAIGQSITQVSPIAVARYVSAIANGGTVYDAQIIDKVIAPDGTIVLEKQPVVANQIVTDKRYFEAIQEGMREVTSGEDGGTAADYFSGINYIAAKTGTSQRTELDVENNSWLVAYAPLDTPQIVVVVYIQNGYAGAYASKAAIKVINYYLSTLTTRETPDITEAYTLAG